MLAMPILVLLYQNSFVMLKVADYFLYLLEYKVAICRSYYYAV